MELRFSLTVFIEIIGFGETVGRWKSCYFSVLKYFWLMILTRSIVLDQCAFCVKPIKKFYSFFSWSAATRSIIKYTFDNFLLCRNLAYYKIITYVFNKSTWTGTGPVCIMRQVILPIKKSSSFFSRSAATRNWSS